MTVHRYTATRVVALLLVVASARAAQSPPSDPSTLPVDAGKAQVFSAADAYQCNCSFSEAPRTIVLYARGVAHAPSGAGEWRAVASCSSLQGPYPSVTLDVARPSDRPRDVLIAVWKRDAAGRWVQEVLDAGFQMLDEFNRRFWQWQTKRADPTRDGALIRLYAREAEVARRRPPRGVWNVRSEASPKWALLNIASAHYTKPAARGLSHDWIAHSLGDVAHALRPYSPSRVAALKSARAKGLQRQDVLDFVRAEARTVKPDADFMVVYYIGHGLGTPQGVWLLMGDLEKLDLKRYTEGAGTAPNAVPPYVLPLEELAAALGATGLPYVLLVDACFDSEDFEALRGFMGAEAAMQGLESGRDEDVLGSLFDMMAQIEYTEKVASYGRDVHPYLVGNNPIVMASAPGWPAYPKPYRPPGGAQRSVGPLAHALLHPGDPRATLAAVIRGTVREAYGDPKATTRAVPRESISWSDFTDFVRVASHVTRQK